MRLIRVPYGNKVAGTVPADVLFAINEHQGLRPVNIQGSEPPTSASSDRYIRGDGEKDTEIRSDSANRSRPLEQPEPSVGKIGRL